MLNGLVALRRFNISHFVSGATLFGARWRQGGRGADVESDPRISGIHACVVIEVGDDVDVGQDV